MEEGINFVKSIKVLNSATGDDHTSKLRCLKGWCNVLRAILGLWEKLKTQHEISFLVTHQLNLKVFGSIRQQGGNSDNPTPPIQFKSAYHKLFHTNLLTVSSANCEHDENEPLPQLSDIQELPEIPQEGSGPLKTVSTDYSSEQIENRVFKDNAMAYIAGYILRKL